MGYIQGRQDQSELDAVHVAVMERVPHRRVFVTREGYLGLGPRDMEVIDQVWILGESNEPFVLREIGKMRLNPSLPAYRLVCDCYVHGIMYREAHDRG